MSESWPLVGRVGERLPAARREELAALTRRSAPRLASAALVGLVVGVVVALFDRLVVGGMQEHLLDAPLWALALAPLAGLVLSAALLQTVGRGTGPATSDVYVEAFHDPSVQVPARVVVARMLGSIATLGAGAPMGLEGPSLFIGGSIGARLQRRAPRLFRDADHRLLMVAGAAAGVAAIFKAPATGAVFALEVPYQHDLARRMLLPALVSSATGYLAFVAINGTDPLFDVAGQPAFDVRDLLGAVALGVAAGIAARSFAFAVRRAKHVALHPMARAGAAGVVLAGLFVVGRLLTGESLTFGPGYGTIDWALDPGRSAWLVVAVLWLRCAATIAAVGGGGVGGLFVPLVVGGALTGRAIGGAIDAMDTDLFLVVGVAAFLGAGYRVPLAAVMFVAETTGRPGFVVPGLLAAVAAELVMGRSSVAAHQLSDP